MKVIRLKIDVSKIDKDRLFKGEKGVYLDCALIESPNNEYNDYVIIESISKEERDEGKKGTIIGNGKELGESKLSEEDIKNLPF